MNRMKEKEVVVGSGDFTPLTDSPWAGSTCRVSGKFHLRGQEAKGLAQLVVQKLSLSIARNIIESSSARLASTSLDYPASIQLQYSSTAVCSRAAFLVYTHSTISDQRPIVLNNVCPFNTTSVDIYAPEPKPESPSLKLRCFFHQSLCFVSIADNMASLPASTDSSARHLMAVSMFAFVR